MNSLRLLRDNLRSIDNVISSLGWENATPLMKTYRHWTIQAMSFIQLKYFEQN